MLASVATQSFAAKMPKLDSSAFDFKYEMEALPTAEDLDNDGNPDFTKWLNGSSTLSADVGCALFDTRADGGGFLQSENGTTGAWARYGATSATGFTVEARIALRQHTSGQYALGLAASVPDSDIRALLNFSVENDSVLHVWWGSTALTNIVHDKEFHTWRIARTANVTTYSVWCDGVLVAEHLGDANQNEWGLLLGSASRAYKMSAYVSYLRFTKGGYAPMTEERDSESFAHKYEMDAGDTRFSATATTSDWTLSGNGAASLSGGILSASVSQGNTYFWRSAPMDSSVTAASPFTLEMKLRVHDSWETAGKVLTIYCGTPREYCILIIGTNDIRWFDKDRHEHIVDMNDNSDKMHTFRIAFTGDGDTAVSSFMLWRDRELVSTQDIKPFAMNNDGNYALFGVGSRSYGGSFEVDYIRWTTDGVFAPVIPPAATTIYIR